MADSVARAYCEGIQRQFNRLPVWLPGTKMRIGDVGLIEDGEFILQTSLSDEGITYVVDDDNSRVGSIEVSSHSGVQDISKLTVDSPLPDLPGVATGHAGLGFKFSGAGQFVLRAYGVTTPRMKNLADVEQEMLNRYEDEKWEFHWVVVTEVCIADQSLVAVANSSDAMVTVDLGVDIGSGPLTLASGGVGASIAHQSDMASTVVEIEPTVVMYRARRLHMDWLGTVSVMDALKRGFASEVPCVQDVSLRDAFSEDGLGERK